MLASAARFSNSSFLLAARRLHHFHRHPFLSHPSQTPPSSPHIIDFPPPHFLPQVRRSIFTASCSPSSTSSISDPLLASSDILSKSSFSSRFTPLPGVDISDFLLKGCKREDAPKCSDYVGTVYIDRTPDGRGRGLYASSDVEAGDVLIISNAFAVSYNDTHNIDLFTKIYGIVKESPLALRQYYSLAGYGSHNELDVPDVRLFDPNTFGNHSLPENLEIDEKKLIHILHVNAFSGELSDVYKGSEGRINGLWLLPSFVNHSCCPNASRLIVGDAMFIIAAKDIKAREEINFSYTDIMTPLMQREDNLGSMGYGFRCECKRCVAERRVQEELMEINERYHLLFDQGADEVYSAVTARERLPVENFPACMGLFDLYKTLMKKVHSFNNLTKVEKHWILSGYSRAFLGKWIISGYGSGFIPPTDFVGSDAVELVEAMRCTEPGLLRTLSFMSILAHVASKEGDTRFLLVQNLVELALHECACVYGKQRLDVTMELMEQSANIVPFF